MFVLQKYFTAIEILLQAIINTHLNNSYCITVVSQISLDLNFPNCLIYISPENENLVDHLLDASEKGCSDYIVSMDTISMFMKAFDKVNHRGNVRRSDRKIVFVPMNENERSKKAILQVLSMREALFVANILLIVPTVDGDTSKCKKYELLTHKFVGEDEDVHETMMLDEWNCCTESFERNSNLFPHDMSDMKGKLLKVATFPYRPYAILDLNEDEAPFGRDGTEIRIMHEFCRWINCTIEIIREDENLWGEIYENQTGVGVLGSVVEDRADVGITALYSWYEEFLFLDFSVSSIRSAVTCLAPAPRLLVSWMTPLLPFTCSMWAAVIVTLIFVSVALTIAMGYKHKYYLHTVQEAALATFAMIIGQSQDDQGNWQIRRVTGLVVMGGLLISSAYGAGLASTFTVPSYENSIDTIQDIVDSKLEWGATHNAWIFSLTPSQEPLIKQLVSQFKMYDAEKLKAKSFRRNIAFSIEKLPAGYFAIGDYITKEAMLDLMLMVEDFYYEQCVVMLRKSSPYTAKISDLIGRLHESGLLLTWETQVALKYLDYNIQLAVKYSRNKKDVEVKPLTFENFTGVFFVYVIGITISIIIFAVEILLRRFAPIKYAAA